MGRIRTRPRDPEIAERNARILALLGGAYAERRKEFHSKGAWQERSVGSKRKVLLGLLSSGRMQQALQAEVGFVPSLHLAESIMRDAFGRVDATMEWRGHLDFTIGFRAAYAGQVLCMDATGFPVRVARSKGGNEKYERRWGHFSFDVASGHGWVSSQASTNEHEGWDPALREFFFALDFAPEWINVDQASALFDGLRHIDEQKEVRLSVGVLLFLAAGCKPYCHQSARPTGGAIIEQAIKGGKDDFNCILVRKAVEKELAGLGLKKARRFESEIEFEAAYAEFQAGLNARPYRGASSRADLWNLSSAREARALRSLASDLAAPVDSGLGTRDSGLRRWQNIVGRARISRLDGGRVTCRNDGKAQAADLTRESLDLLAAAGCRPTELLTLTMPGGLRAGDDPDLVRCVIVQPPDSNGAQPSYHAVEARCAKVDEYFQDLRKPLIGQFEGAVEGQKDRFARARDEAAASWRERVGRPGKPARQIREATNDSVLKSE